MKKIPKKIIWDTEKNNLLIATRGIGFEEIEMQIKNNSIIEILKNQSSDYKNQYLLIFKYQDYIWNCPCLIEKGKIVLKTLFKNRKHNTLYS